MARKKKMTKTREEEVIYLTFISSSFLAVLSSTKPNIQFFLSLISSLFDFKFDHYPSAETNIQTAKI